LYGDEAAFGGSLETLTQHIQAGRENDPLELSGKLFAGFLSSLRVAKPASPGVLCEYWCPLQRAIKLLLSLDDSNTLPDLAADAAAKERLMSAMLRMWDKSQADWALEVAVVKPEKAGYDLVFVRALTIRSTHMGPDGSNAKRGGGPVSTDEWGGSGSSSPRQHQNQWQKSGSKSTWQCPKDAGSSWHY
jgi:hypothetical protein